MVPSTQCISPKMAARSEDLPLPTKPASPTSDPGAISRETDLSVGSLRHSSLLVQTKEQSLRRISPARKAMGRVYSFRASAHHPGKKNATPPGC